MAIKNRASPWNTPSDRVKPTDLNNTVSYLEELASILAQVPYNSLVTHGDWTNQASMGGDLFSSASGINSTVNTGVSTTYFFTDKYTLNTTHTVLPGTLHDPDSMTNASNGVDGDDGTYAEKSYDGAGSDTKIDSLGKTFTSQHIYWVKYKMQTITDSGGNARNHRHRIQTYDGSTWTTAATILNLSGVNDNNTSSGQYYLNATVQGIRLQVETSGALDATWRNRIYDVQYGVYSSSSLLQQDSSTLTLSGTEHSVAVFTNASVIADTSIGLVLSDGTNSTSSVSIANGMTTNIIPVTGLTGGTLQLKYTLATTDTTKTPAVIGNGFVKR